MTNVNPETGIRYGIISAQSLHPDVIYDLQCVGKDLHYEEFCEDLKRQFPDEDEYEEQLENIDFQDEEPVHEFQRDGVRGQTTWLGGAMLVWVFHSPHIANVSLCSPCVPNCGDLDSTGDYECYDVPPTWREK